MLGGREPGHIRRAGSARWATRATAALIDLTVDAGLEVQEVLVEGRNETDRAAVMAAIQVKSGDPIMKFDPEARAPGWSACAGSPPPRSSGVFPTPSSSSWTSAARWRFGSATASLALIDRDGEGLTERELGRYNNLLQIIGADAPKHAQELPRPSGYRAGPVPAGQPATRIGGRRWDLHLTNGVVIRLPESDIGGALHHLADQEAKQPVLDRDIVAVDLRLPDRLVIQTSTTAAQRRRAPEQKI